MSTEFDKIKQDIHDFNARIKSWKLDDLSDEEADEINDELELTLDLLAGENGYEDEEDVEDVDEP